MINSKLILKIYRLLPATIKNNERVISFVMPIAERELAKTKHDVIKANWERDRLQHKVAELKNNRI